jgi:hypothetical protein
MRRHGDSRSEHLLRQVVEISAPKSSWTPVPPQHIKINKMAD